MSWSEEESPLGRKSHSYPSLHMSIIWLQVLGHLWAQQLLPRKVRGKNNALGTSSLLWAKHKNHLPLATWLTLLPVRADSETNQSRSECGNAESSLQHWGFKSYSLEKSIRDQKCILAFLYSSLGRVLWRGAFAQNGDKALNLWQKMFTKSCEPSD